MKMPHPYQRNGLGAIDENGHVPCAICGRPRSQHTTEAVRIEPDTIQVGICRFPNPLRRSTSERER